MRWAGLLLSCGRGRAHSLGLGYRTQRRQVAEARSACVSLAAEPAMNCPSSQREVRASRSVPIRAKPGQCRRFRECLLPLTVTWNGPSPYPPRTVLFSVPFLSRPMRIELGDQPARIRLLNSAGSRIDMPSAISNTSPRTMPRVAQSELDRTPVTRIPIHIPRVS